MTDIFSTRRIVLMVVLLGVLGLLYDKTRIKPTPSESALLQIIGRIEGAQPIKSRSRFTVLPCMTDYYLYPKACTTQDVRFENLKIGEVDFRPVGSGSIIELNEVGPECIRLALVQAKYSGGKVENSCDHGYCGYYGLQRSWGRLSFRLADDSDDNQCVRNVVFNTDFYR